MGVQEIINESTMAPITLKKKLIRLRAIFAYGIEIGWIETNPIARTMFPKDRPKEVVVCTDEQLELIIRELNESKNWEAALCVEFALLTGMRITEIMELSWENIKSRYMIFTGKGSHERIIPFRPFPRILSILGELREKGNERKPFSWRDRSGPSTNLRNAIKSLSQKYGNMNWQGISFHTFRRIAINRWETAGITDKARNKMAGHTKLVEEKYYFTEADIGYLENEFQKIEDVGRN